MWLSSLVLGVQSEKRGPKRTCRLLFLFPKCRIFIFIFVIDTVIQHTEEILSCNSRKELFTFVQGNIRTVVDECYDGIAEMLQSSFFNKRFVSSFVGAAKLMGWVPRVFLWKILTPRNFEFFKLFTSIFSVYGNCSLINL